jgi:short-subunit dehydrogenase
MDLKDAVCIVTGASSGIGRATALSLARRGAVVSISARREGKLAEALEECRAHSPRSMAVRCDVADPGAVRAMVERTEREAGPVDVLVANAGVGRYVPFTEETIETIEEQVRINLLGQLYATHAVLPGMQARRRGHLVFLSSTNARLFPPMQSVYTATRAATMGFAEALSYETERFGIGMTIVYPGPIDTEFFDAPEFQKMRTPKKIPAEKVGEAIARAVERGKRNVAIPAALTIPAKLRALFPRMIHKGTAKYAKDALPKP